MRFCARWRLLGPVFASFATQVWPSTLHSTKFRICFSMPQWHQHFVLLRSITSFGTILKIFVFSILESRFPNLRTSERSAARAKALRALSVISPPWAPSPPTSPPHRSFRYAINVQQQNLTTSLASRSHVAHRSQDCFNSS